MSRRVLRHEVPVDDQWHRIEYEGRVVHVASRTSGVVEFWTAPAAKIPTVTTGGGHLVSIAYHEISEPRVEWFRVFGTGHEVDGLWYGTTFDAATSSVVWHLFGREFPDSAEPTKERSE